MEKLWNCVECGYIVSDGQSAWDNCPKCGGSFLIIPARMDNNLFLAIDDVVTYFYKLDVILNQREDAVELSDSYSRKVATIRNWEDFKYFFGNYFYVRYFKEVE